MSPQTVAPSISVVLPVYNEEGLLETAVQRCLSSADAFEDFEIILIDDGSADGTGAVMRRLAEADARVRVLRNNINLNVGVSIQRGFAIARMTYLLHTAVDLPLEPDAVAPLITSSPEFDVLVLQRKAYPNASPWRRVTSLVNRGLRRACFPRAAAGVHDMNFTQIYRRSVLDKVLPLAKSPAFTTPEMILRAANAGLRVVAVEVDYQPRSGGGGGAFGRPHDIAWTMYDMARFRVRTLGGKSP